MKPWKCTKCPAAFGIRALLNRHNSSVHERNKPFLCTECNKSFPRADSLKIHTRNVHGKQKLFSCSQCNMQFSAKQHVERHFKRIHKDAKGEIFEKIVLENESKSEIQPVEFVQIGEEINRENSVITYDFKSGKLCNENFVYLWIKYG